GREVFNPFDRVELLSGESQRAAAFARLELQRQNAHSDEVAAVDAFIAFGDHGADTQKRGAFGGPIPGGAGAVLFAGQDDQGNFFPAVADGGVKNGGRFAARQMARVAALGAGGELIAQADIGEGPAHHYFIVSAPRAVRVEIFSRDSVLGEIDSRGT